MKLQLALDLIDSEAALDVVRQTGPHVDLIEIGTSLLKSCGTSLVQDIRRICPGKPLFIDSKIIDGPEREADLMTKCGAEYYSMLAVATDAAVVKVLKSADASGALVVFDLQSVIDPVSRVKELENLGARAVCVHKNADCGDDLSGAFQEFLDIREVSNVAVTLAGGIDGDTLLRIRDELDPDTVVIGGAILNAPDRGDAAKTMFDLINSRRKDIRS